MASLEYLVGLMATACPPASAREWLAWWNTPPQPEELAARFAPFAQSFNLDCDRPRFMQDFEELAAESASPETLLIEAPGDAGRRNNTTLLVKSDRVLRLSRAAAAIALFTLQTYAPAGGRGNLTSLRGGGPLTTLVLPGTARDNEPLSLWHLIWANVPYGRPADTSTLARVFPWLAPTRSADRFPKTIPDENADPLQAYWGMPRRIRLEFSPNPQGHTCDLTGDIDSVIVTGWRQRPNGVRYDKWSHPLAPDYNEKNGGWLPVHPQPGGIGYRHWLGLTLADDKAKTRRRAACVGTWLDGRQLNVPKPVRLRTRLLAAGYDMDNMKARAFTESEMPLPGSDDPAAEKAMRQRAETLVAAAEEVASTLRRAVRDASYGADASLDAGPIATAFESFWSETQDAFFDQLRQAADSSANPEAADSSANPEAAEQVASQQWRALMRRVALRLFDEAAPLDPSAVSFKPERIVHERRKLVSMFGGYGAAGNRLFTTLGLPLPEQAKPKAARRGNTKELA